MSGNDVRLSVQDVQLCTILRVYNCQQFFDTLFDVGRSMFDVGCSIFSVIRALEVSYEDMRLCLPFLTPKTKFSQQNWCK